ncbi:MAG: ClbS/DfsB family four-helix bundle protein [Anaerolineales bacterium]
MTRAELRRELERSRSELEKGIEGLGEAELLQPGVVGAWSVRDVLQHLSIWEAETIQLILGFRRGGRPPSDRFSEGVDALNAKWHAATRHRPLDRVLADFHAVRKQTLKQIEDLTEDELSRPSHFPWLEGRPLAQWIAEDTYLHEREHAGQIRSWRERLAPPAPTE